MFGLLYVHQKSGLFPFTFRNFTARLHPPLTNFITYPLCFLTAYSFDVASQLFSRERGGASDSKNPDLYYSYFYLSFVSIFCMLVAILEIGFILSFSFG